MTTMRPYGDATDDGMIQLSFTLPVGASERSRQAALKLARDMGVERPQVVHMKGMGADFTFFILYGSTSHSVDPEELVVEERDFPVLPYPEVNRSIRDALRRPLVVVGACTGTDAHTVGLDAILSMKGYAGDHGLEYYTEMKVVNLGAQVTPSEVATAAREHGADAVLISQVVTQRNAHLVHLQEVKEALVATGLRDRLILVGGGPRFSHEQAVDLGYDRIFGRWTRPSEVASYLVHAVLKRAAA